MTNNNDDELLRALRSGTHRAEYVTLGGVEHDTRCLAAEVRIRELKAELQAKSDALAVLDVKGVLGGTHVIVPVEPTEAMELAAWNAPSGGLVKGIYRAMIQSTLEK